MTTTDTPAWDAILGFGLATPQHFDPQAILTGDDDVDGFVLGLALAYNDLKSVQWMNFMLHKHRPSDTGELTGSVGQWNGVQVGATRWIMAISHELLFTISRASQGAILKRQPITRAVARMPKSHRTR